MSSILETSSGRTTPTCIPDQPMQELQLQRKEFENISSQFCMPVVISTFAASVIVAFLSLVRDIVDDAYPTLFYIGTLFSFLAMSLHLAIIIIASRGAALASLYSIDPKDEDKPKAEKLRYYFALCDQLQLFATLLFVVTIGVHIFVIFKDYVWPSVLLCWSTLLAAVIYQVGFSEDSLLVQDVKWIQKNLKFPKWCSPSKAGAPEGPHDLEAVPSRRPF